MQPEYPSFDFNGMSEEEVAKTICQQQLALTPEEALLIQNEILQRPPTLAECHLWSIQGSEHCSYKSSRHFLSSLPTDGPNVILGPKEDAGIVCVATDNAGLRYGIAMSHESHNHPSQIVPYEGAATGVGGNMRDICCMGAEVVAMGDGLRFGALDRKQTHWIYEGVRDGISHYGNATGIPNLAGDLYFHPGYNDNCLVTVVTLGTVREDHILHSYVPPEGADYFYILVGKATDNSGFGGASFASANMDEDSASAQKGAVQEPNAFLKRVLLKANYALFQQLQEQDLCSKVGFKDLGAGGVACASVEMAEAGGFGAEVDVERIPQSMDDLPAHVALCSETQERFLWAVPESMVARILSHYNEHFSLPEISYGAQAAVVGKVRSDGRYLVRHHGQTIVDAKASDVTEGLQYQPPVERLQKPDVRDALPDYNPNEILLALLADENIACKRALYETYDKQVQGRTHIEAGDSDAGVITPFNEPKYPQEIQNTGVALSLDHNPSINAIDAYWGAVHAVVESVRNVAAVGARPQAISDCLCFGNPENPQRMGEFSEAIRGIRDACAAVGLLNQPEAPLPVIAGNVSLYNESPQGSIPPSPLIACLGSMPDANKAISKHLQARNSHLLLIGERQGRLGGSLLSQHLGIQRSDVPEIALDGLHNEIYALTEAIDKGLLLAAHDISEGGVAVALAEMAFHHNIGIRLHADTHFKQVEALFEESGGFLLEVSEENLEALDKHFASYGLKTTAIGRTQTEAILSYGFGISLPVEEAKVRWTNGLQEKLL